MLVGQLLAQERTRLSYAGVALETSYDPALVWEYDSAMLCSVLHHAIQNAMHYASNKIRLQLAVSGGKLEIRVEDNGPGFPQAMLDAGVSLPPSVFEAWFVTAAHDETAVSRILEALPAAARAAAAAVKRGA